jgi:hypothetical protein
MFHERKQHLVMVERGVIEMYVIQATLVTEVMGVMGVTGVDGNQLIYGMIMRFRNIFMICL